MTLVLPITLSNGTLADASQVMADLNTIVSYINNLPATGSNGPGRVVAGGTTVAGSASTDGLVVVQNVTTNQTVYQLPSTPSVNQIVTIKDGSANFQSYPCTVVTIDGSKIDQITGATGVVLRSNGQSQVFQYVGGQWWLL
jgi:hypothetical protein